MWTRACIGRPRSSVYSCRSRAIGGLLGGLCAARIVRRLGEIGAAAFGVAAFGLPGLVLAFPNLITAIPAMILAGSGSRPRSSDSTR